MPLNAPNTASSVRDLACVCTSAVTPEAATTAIFTINVVVYAVPKVGCSAAMFQTPVTTSSANAGHAIRLKRRAAARVASGPASGPEGAQAGDEAGEGDLATDPHRRPEHVEEQADGGGGHGQHGRRSYPR